MAARQELVLIGVVFIAGGLVTTWVAVGYFRGTGFRHSPVGTPAMGIGAGPAGVAIGLLALLGFPAGSAADNALSLGLLGVFILGSTVGVVLGLSKPLLGWPPYGMLPNLFRLKRHASPPA